MSKEQLVAELEKLTPEERWEVLSVFWSPERQDDLHPPGPSEEEKALLDRELEEYAKDGNRGEPWEKVIAELRKKS